MTMRFEEVTERLGVTVNHAGHADDGLPLNVAIPAMNTIRIWQAVYGGYTWAIMFEPGLPKWSEEEREKHAGYTASYRRADHRTSSQTMRIDGGPWDSFVKAEESCKKIWKQVRNAS